MYIYPDKVPLYRSGRQRIAVYRLRLDCGHDGGLVDEGKRALRRKCHDCGGVQRRVVGYEGKEVAGV